MKDILVRSMTGMVFVSVVLACLFYNDYSSTLLFGLLMLMAIAEFLRMLQNQVILELNTVTLILQCISLYALLSSISLGLLASHWFVLIYPILFVGFIVELWRNSKNSILSIGGNLLGLIYLLVPFYTMQELSILSVDGQQLVVAVFILVWVNDSFAYLTGRLIGRTKLFERISPKKTWEGTMGGVLFSLLAGWLIANYMMEDQDIGFWMISGGFIAISATLGDLIESMFKRQLEVKDSGTLLPGHGGVLDRFDAVMLAAPVFYAWYTIYIYL